MKAKVTVAAVVVMVAVAVVATAQRGPGRGGAGCRMLQGVPVGTLDAAETAGVLFTREEEKLARDVYMALFETWQDAELGRIGVAEQRHMDAMKALIERHELTDPVGTSPAGVFASPQLAELYVELVARGRQSRVEALKVGALIEELDIHDVQALLATTDEADLQQVYGNLARGSRNHLRAFAAALAEEGATYVPVHLTADEYAAIVSSAWERGGGRGRGTMGRGRHGRFGNGPGTCTNPGQGTGPGQGSGPGQGKGGNGPGKP